MPSFAANIALMYTELPFLARFGAAARDGFYAVEFPFPYAYPAEILAEALAQNKLQQAIISTPAGGRNPREMQDAWAQGMRGTLCQPCEVESFRSGMMRALHYAKILQCPRIHVLSGILPAGLGRELALHTVLANLQWAEKAAADADVQILLEPVPAAARPSYYLQTQEQAHNLVQMLSSPHVKVLMDIYHCQRGEGDVASKLHMYLPTGRVGYLQIAGVPSQHEPHIGELNYVYLLDLIKDLGYTGWIGCEYRPRNGTTQGLHWMRQVQRTHAYIK